MSLLTVSNAFSRHMAVCVKYSKISILAIRLPDDFVNYLAFWRPQSDRLVKGALISENL